MVRLKELSIVDAYEVGCVSDLAHADFMLLVYLSLTESRMGLQAYTEISLVNLN